MSYQLISYCLTVGRSKNLSFPGCHRFVLGTRMNLLATTRGTTILAVLFAFIVTPYVSAQLKVDFTRAPNVKPLQLGWQPFQADDIFATETFELDGDSIDVTVEGNTHWRDYREATRGFEPWSDLLRDGVLCNAACDLSLTVDGLPDGDYDLRVYLHTTQFGELDGRPFTPFEITMSDGVVSDEVVNGAAFMSDDGSDDLSTELFSFTIENGSAFVGRFTKFEGIDHMQISGFELGATGSLGPPPEINHPESDTIVIDFPDGLMVDLSRDPDELPLQNGWEGFFGELVDGTTRFFDFDGQDVTITIEGNTHWRDYRAAAAPFDNYADLLSDGAICNSACLMTVTIEGLEDGDYEFLAINHTTQFGDQDGRPFNEFEIRLTDANGEDQVINAEALMSDDSSEEISLEAIPFTVANDSATQVIFEKFGGIDHFALAGFVLSEGAEPDPCNPNSLGDLDGNGKVEFADFLVLAGNFNTDAADHTTGDIDCNGKVEFADFLVLAGNFGMKVGPASVVPEPTGLSLFGLSGLGALTRRRRRR